MRRYHIFFLLISVMLFASCAGKGPKAPSNNEVDLKSRFPEGLYVLRMGSGQTAESASDAARFEIAKFFESSIEGNTTVRQWGRSETRRGKVITGQVTEIAGEIAVASKRDIPGIEIASLRKMPDGDYEAWAALSKTNYAAHVRERIDAIDARVAELGAARPVSDIDAARKLAKSAAFLLDREKVRADLVSINRVQSVSSSGERYAAVMTSLDSVLTRRLELGVVADPVMGESLSEGLATIITDAGFRTKRYDGISEAVREKADLIIRIGASISERITTTTVQSKEKTLYWNDWVLTLNAIDPLTRDSAAATMLNGKSSGLDPDQARSRMEYAILNGKSDALAAWIYDLIFDRKEIR